MPLAWQNTSIQRRSETPCIFQLKFNLGIFVGKIVFLSWSIPTIFSSGFKVWYYHSIYDDDSCQATCSCSDLQFNQNLSLYLGSVGRCYVSIWECEENHFCYSLVNVESYFKLFATLLENLLIISMLVKISLHVTRHSFGRYCMLYEFQLCVNLTVTIIL